MVNIKRSYGIICCRKHIKNGFQVILIKKPITYHFCEFISGHYRKNDEQHLRKLFNNMTYHEKIDILSMKFNNMWYRMYKTNPDQVFLQANGSSISKQYYKKKNKFETSFLQDGGCKLRSLISDSINAETLWEIPKGRKKEHTDTKNKEKKIYETKKQENINITYNNRKDGIDPVKNLPWRNKTDTTHAPIEYKFHREDNINAAIREFSEETTISADKYKILWHLKPYIETYSDFGITYQNIFYYAETIGDWEPNIKFSNNQQISEVSAIRWCGKTDLNHMALEKTTYQRLLNMFVKVYKKYNNYKKKRNA